MILSDRDLALKCDDTRVKHPLVSPFKPENLQPASIDLTLDSLFLVPSGKRSIDLSMVKETTDYNKIHAPLVFVLHPEEFVLGSTVEKTCVPNNLVGRVEGKSSLGRLGLLIHSTAGYVDPGFHGTITLELYNLGHEAIVLRPGLCICQISFQEMTSTAQNPYGSKKLKSKYQGQEETTASRYQG